MKAIRLVLHQNFAHYKKEHSIKNRLTYPLPPASTIIGAIHSICKWKEYHDMNVSIQGTYDSIDDIIRTMNVYQDNTMNDRGILVKTCDKNIIYGKPIYVSTALKQGSRHIEQQDTILHHPELLEEYINLKSSKEEKNKEKKEVESKYKDILNNIKNQKKDLDKKSSEYTALVENENKIKTEKETTINSLKSEIEDLDNKIGKYKTLVTTLQYYEILSDVNLIIHIKPESEDDIATIMDNIYRLDHIGRTEDSVQIIEASIVELEKPKRETYSYKNYIAYIPLDMIEDESILTKLKSGVDMGTIYYINKNYEVVDNKRKFVKKPVLLLSEYSADSDSVNVWKDSYNNENILVAFI